MGAFGSGRPQAGEVGEGAGHGSEREPGLGSSGEGAGRALPGPLASVSSGWWSEVLSPVSVLTGTSKTVLSDMRGLIS